MEWMYLLSGLVYVVAFFIFPWSVIFGAVIGTMLGLPAVGCALCALGVAWLSPDGADLFSRD